MFSINMFNMFSIITRLTENWTKPVDGEFPCKIPRQRIDFYTWKSLRSHLTRPNYRAWGAGKAKKTNKHSRYCDSQCVLRCTVNAKTYPRPVDTAPTTNGVPDTASCFVPSHGGGKRAQPLLSQQKKKKSNNRTE